MRQERKKIGDKAKVFFHCVVHSEERTFDSIDLITSGNIVNAVEIARSFLIKHVLSFSTNNFQRIRFVEQLA